MTTVQPPKQDFDPRLKEAAEEIKAVLRKYDIGALVTLVSGNGHAEYVNHIAGPTWSAITIEGGGMRIRAAVKSAPAEERLMERLKLQKTVNMVVLLRDTLLRQATMFVDMARQLRQHVAWDESEPGHKGDRS